jgi:hypothetical protein
VGVTLLHPVGLELVLLLVRSKAVDGVLQSALIATDPRGNSLPGSVSHNVAARRSES